MYKYQCDKGSLAPIFEDSGRSVFDEAIARSNRQSSTEDVINVLGNYKRLVLDTNQKLKDDMGELVFYDHKAPTGLLP